MLAATSGCQESGFDERKETSRPLKVQHAGDPPRESKVPGQSSRPATLTEDALGDTLALGVKPMLAAVPDGTAPGYLRERVDGVTLVQGGSTGVDIEAVLAADPDLILGSEERHAAAYESLTKVAPTVLTSGTSADWKLGLRLHGEALGRVNSAEALLVDWDDRVAAVRDGLAAGTPPSVSVLLVEATGVRAAGARSFAGGVLADLGLRRPAAQRQTEEPFTTVDADRIETQDADVILLSVAPGAEAEARRLQAGAAWQSLEPRVKRVDSEIWWGPGGILAGRAALADLQEILQR